MQGLVTQLPALQGRLIPGGGDCELPGLPLVVPGEELVRGQAAQVLIRNPRGSQLGERPARPARVRHDRLVVEPRPDVDHNIADAHRGPPRTARPRARLRPE